jgi:hypothetical protein
MKMTDNKFLNLDRNQRLMIVFMSMNKIFPIPTDIYSLFKIVFISIFYYYFLWLCSPARAMASSFTRFCDHTQRRATVGRNPLDEWSARRRDLYLTTHNTHTTNIDSPDGIQTHDRRPAVTGTGDKTAFTYEYYSSANLRIWNIFPLGFLTKIL